MSRASSAGRHRVFRAVLSALAEPGTHQPLPVADGDGHDPMAIVYDAVWEATTPVYVAAGSRSLPGRHVAPEVAAVLRGRGDDDELIVLADPGTALQPELGATVLLDAVAPLPVVLRGPGIDGARQIELGVSAAVLAARARRCADPPCGIDVLVIDDHGVTGLPRTTAVQLLPVGVVTR